MSASDEATPDRSAADTSAPDPVRATAPQAPPAPDDESEGLDRYLDEDRPAVMPVAGMAAGTVPRAPRDEENK